MTAGFGLAGAPSSVIYAKRLQVGIVKFIGVLPMSASDPKAFEGLERLDAKVSRAVLRGGSGGNAASLPDRRRRNRETGVSWKKRAVERLREAPIARSVLLKG